jgi:hypothetical protein
MSICDREATFEALELPPGLDELEGLIVSDLQAIVSMVTTAAHSRLFLTKREFRGLQQDLWNRMVGAINESVAPLSVESR